MVRLADEVALILAAHETGRFESRDSPEVVRVDGLTDGGVERGRVGIAAARIASAHYIGLGRGDRHKSAGDADCQRKNDCGKMVALHIFGFLLVACQ